MDESYKLNRQIVGKLDSWTRPFVTGSSLCFRFKEVHQRAKKTQPQIQHVCCLFKSPGGNIIQLFFQLQSLNHSNQSPALYLYSCSL